MPTTCHLTLLQGAAAALQALVTVPASRVFVERPSPVLADECPAIGLVSDGARFQRYGSERAGGTGLLRATVGVRLRVHTRGDPHTQQADPIVAEAHAALMADPSLGGLCQQLNLVDSRPQQARADGTAGTWELSYQLEAIVDEATLAVLSG